MPKIDIRKDGASLVLVGLDPLENACHCDELASETGERGLIKRRPPAVEAIVSRQITSATGAALLFKVFGQSRAWDVDDRDGQVIATLDAPEGNTVRDIESSTLDGALVNGWALEWEVGGNLCESLSVEAQRKTFRSLITQDEAVGNTVRV